MITRNLDRLFEELKPLTLQQKQSFVMRMIGCLAPMMMEVHWEYAISEARKGLCTPTEAAKDAKKTAEILTSGHV